MRKLAFISLAALLAASVAQATPITISNAGFEDNVTRNQVTNYNLLDGEFNDVSAVTGDRVPDWNWEAFDPAPPEFSYGGAANPPPSGWGLDQAPEGENAAYTQSSWGIRTLTATFESNTVYTLTIQVAQAGGTNTPYQVGIAAPDSAFLAGTTGTVATAGSFSTLTVVYDTTGSSGVVGEPIKIAFGSSGQVFWDDVRLGLQGPFKPLIARGTRLFSTGFEEDTPLEGWTNEGIEACAVVTFLEDYGNYLTITGNDWNARKQALVRPLGTDVLALCGYTLRFKARMAAFSAAGQTLSGDEVQLKAVIHHEGGDTSSHQAEIPFEAGKYNFGPNSISFDVLVPGDTVGIDLRLGLDTMEGWVTFDDVVVEIVRAPRGGMFFFTDFEELSPGVAHSGTPGEVTRVDMQDRGKVLSVSRTVNDGATIASVILPSEGTASHTFYLSGLVKGENVSYDPTGYLGVTLMMVVWAPSLPGGVTYRSVPTPTGSSFDWTEFSTTILVPEDVTDLQLRMGLQNVSGTAWFDDLKITVGREPFVPHPAVPESTPVYTGHDPLPRLRGAHINPAIQTHDDADEIIGSLGDEWNGNLIRYSLHANQGKDGAGIPIPCASLAEYESTIMEELDRLDTYIIPACRASRLLILLDLHTAPHFVQDNVNSNLWNSAACQDKFVEIWETIAARYNDEPLIWGYELFNEPGDDVLPVPANLLFSDELAERAGKAIRAIDSETAIIVQPPRGGQAAGFAMINPIDVPNVVYSFHCYSPYKITYQRIPGYGFDADYAYPGYVGSFYWDSNALRQVMQPAIDFANRYKVQMFVGEFNAIRWTLPLETYTGTPTEADGGGAYNYIRDCIELFEEQGWDWSFFIFKWWHGWDSEYSTIRYGDNTAGGEERHETPRSLLLKRWFGQNERLSSSVSGGCIFIIR